MSPRASSDLDSLFQCSSFLRIAARLRGSLISSLSCLSSSLIRDIGPLRFSASYRARRTDLAVAAYGPSPMSTPQPISSDTKLTNIGECADKEESQLNVG